MVENKLSTEFDASTNPFDYLKSKIMSEDEIIFNSQEGISIMIFSFPPVYEGEPEVLDIQIMKFPKEDDEYALPDGLWMKVDSNNEAAWMSGNLGLVGLDYSSYDFLYEEEDNEQDEVDDLISGMESDEFKQVMREHAKILAKYVQESLSKGEIVKTDDLSET